MRTTIAHWCTATLLSIIFTSLGQTPQLNDVIKEHVLSHAKPGMSQFQMDSLNDVAKEKSKQQHIALMELIKSAQIANKNSNQNKTEECLAANWGFENGNTNNWQTSGCVALENGGVDIYSGFPKVNNGNFSLKLSNDMNYGCLNSAIARTYSVPVSGETFITIHFAVNIFNFPHTADYAAKFNFNLFDEDMNQLECPTYQAYYAFDEGPVGIPSLQETPLPAAAYNPSVAGDLSFNSNVSSSNWHHVTIDLTNYAGTDITLVFQNLWCAFDVDWIYTYIDVDCPINNNQPIPVCMDGEFELCAPQGMSASYDWEFNDLPLNTNQSCITATNTGTYTLNFMPTYLECSNRPYEITFELVDQPNADFSVADFCAGDPVVVQNTSSFGTNYEWHYDGNIQYTEQPSINYEPGVDEITLIVINGNCRDTAVMPIIERQYPNPKFIFENACVGSHYKILNQSTDIENTPLEVVWTISNNYQSTDWDPTFIAENDQEFVIALNVTNQYGCSAEIQSKAKAYPLPTANFSQSENVLSENAALVHFQDESSDNATMWEWYIDNQKVYSGTEFFHEFMGTGQFPVTLVVQNAFGCYDTAHNTVEVIPSVSLYIPNTFTPNGDDQNDFLLPVFSGSNVDLNTYQFRVFNRWGEVVFATENIQHGWDGLFKGDPCIQGTYSWELEFKELRSVKHERMVGHVNLLR